MLDFGSGIGNEAYFFVNEFDCDVDCINISDAENAGAYELIRKAEPELLDRIKLITSDEHRFKPKEKYDGFVSRRSA
ncbi:MAG: hypothetical protein CM15mV101_520 [uncultured marine virus]|nr:MAG: hypothetical protein CM15mV101_520 [uncultured marine virus]